ncbi:MAG TPA: SDR family oxidoreductase [Candidatus Binataceae bacterium]|nr:SDR family oxidoreductase [Candidatus Binataceae bacterium]
MASVLSEFSLEGKAALVVGAETPVGIAASTALAEAGARVMMASQDVGAEKQLKDAAKKITTNASRIVVRVQRAAIRADLSATADLALKELGGLDILVNALDSPAYGPADQTDDSVFDRVIEDNLKTVWMSCQEAARVMLQRRGGTIVNITSILAHRGVPNASLYCAAKAGVLNLTRALALEWARRSIRVNAIEAGWLDSPPSPAVAQNEFAQNLLKYLPDNKLVSPNELCGVLLYLVSSASGFVTGESIAVDGALLCRI